MSDQSGAIFAAARRAIRARRRSQPAAEAPAECRRPPRPPPADEGVAGSPTVPSRTASRSFTTATALIEELLRTTRAGKLRNLLATHTHPYVLVIDEVGHLTYGPHATYGPDAANVLFQVVNNRYLHRRPMIFTTNKAHRSEFSEITGQIFRNPQAYWAKHSLKRLSACIFY